MKFIVDGTKYEFDETRITFAEARAMEKATGKTMIELERLGGIYDATSLQATIWVAMKRSEPTLKFADLDDMNIGDIEQIPAEPEEPPGDDDAGDPPAAADAAPGAEAAEQTAEDSTPNG